MSDSCSSVLMRFSLASMPTTQFFVNERDAMGMFVPVTHDKQRKTTHHPRANECSGARS